MKSKYVIFSSIFYVFTVSLLSLLSVSYWLVEYLSFCTSTVYGQFALVFSWTNPKSRNWSEKKDMSTEPVLFYLDLVPCSGKIPGSGSLTLPWLYAVMRIRIIKMRIRIRRLKKMQMQPDPVCTPSTAFCSLHSFLSAFKNELKLVKRTLQEKIC